MENFKEFELQKLELITGGDLIICDSLGSDGRLHRDIYNTDTNTIIYLPPGD